MDITAPAIGTATTSENEEFEQIWQSLSDLSASSTEPIELTQT